MTLGSNSFTRFPEIVTQLSSLKQLDLSGNAIPYLPRGISKMANRLVTFDVSKNLLKAVPPEFDHFYKTVKHIFVDNNPWSDLPDKWNTR